MYKKIIALLLCMAFLMLSLTSCGSGSNGKIVTPIDSDPEYLDPQIISQSGAKNIVLNCFEGLVAFDSEGKIVSAAAESYDVSSDGKTYVFNLRHDGQWRLTSGAKKLIGSDNVESFRTAVTASDFVFALRRALQPETKCPYASSLMNIKNAKKVNDGKLSSSKLGVTAQDDYTLKITLERSDVDFLSALTLPSCMPCHEEFFNLTKGRYGLTADNLIYNGPFYLSNWAENTAITIRRNSSYHSLGDSVSKEVKPSSVYFSINSEQSTRDKKLTDGTYDIAPLTAAQAQSLSQKSSVTQKSFQNSMLEIIFNCSDEVISNQKIRKAMVYALDSKLFLDYYGASAAQGVFPDALIFGGESYRKNAGSFKTNPYDTKQAQKLMSSAMEELEASDIDLTILCSVENETIVRSAMQQWQSAFGVKFGISVEALDSKTLRERIESGKYQLALYEGMFGDVTAQNAAASFLSSSGLNYSKNQSKTYDKTVESLCISSSKRELLKECESYLLSSCAVMPICQANMVYGIAKGCDGFVFCPTGDMISFKNVTKK